MMGWDPSHAAQELDVMTSVTFVERWEKKKRKGVLQDMKPKIFFRINIQILCKKCDAVINLFLKDVKYKI